MLKPKQIKQALVARDMALQLGNYADDRMRIEHKPGPPHELAIWWTDSKVLAVIWHDDERNVVVTYRFGAWEWHLKRKAVALLLPGSGL